MTRLKGTATAAVRWVGAEIAPIVLLPLAAVLVWVSVFALPWHVYVWAREGGAFTSAFLWKNLLLRSAHAMHGPLGR